MQCTKELADEEKSEKEASMIGIAPTPSLSVVDPSVAMYCNKKALAPLVGGYVENGDLNSV